MFIPGTARPGEPGGMRDFTPRRFDTAAGTIAIDFVWIAAEAEVARAVRRLIERRGHPRERLEASGYSRRGDVGVLVRIEA